MGTKGRTKGSEIAQAGSITTFGVHMNENEEDICGLCGRPGADKFAHPIHWPGERVPGGPLVHEACEDAECRRAHEELTDAERAAFLRTC